MTPQRLIRVLAVLVVILLIAVGVLTVFVIRSSGRLEVHRDMGTVTIVGQGTFGTEDGSWDYGAETPGASLVVKGAKVTVVHAVVDTQDLALAIEKP
jgi:hypothetical protein